MDKLTTRDMDYLFMDRNNSYLAEPFGLMKNIKPCFIDEHFEDIKKRIINLKEDGNNVKWSNFKI